MLHEPLAGRHMPVDPIPAIIVLLLLLLPAGAWIRSRRAAIGIILIESVFIVTTIACILAPGIGLRWKARAGDPFSEYQLSRWYMTNWFARNFEPATRSSLSWLQAAADAEFVPALYAVGYPLQVWPWSAQTSGLERRGR